MKSVFKSDLVQRRAKYLNLETFNLLVEMVQWCALQGIDIVITETASTPQEDEFLKRVSSTHREGRAFDIRTEGWTPAQKEAFQIFFNNKYLHMGAISPETEEPVLIVYHNAGTGFHFHVQLSRKYKRDIKFLEEDLI